MTDERRLSRFSMKQKKTQSELLAIWMSAQEHLDGPEDDSPEDYLRLIFRAGNDGLRLGEINLARLQFLSHLSSHDKCRPSRQEVCMAFAVWAAASSIYMAKKLGIDVDSIFHEKEK